MKKILITIICICSYCCLMAQKNMEFDSSILTVKPFYECEFSDSAIVGNDTIYLERNIIDNLIRLFIKDSIIKQKSPIINLEELDKYGPYVFNRVGIVKYLKGFIIEYYFPDKLGHTGAYKVYDVFRITESGNYYRLESFFFSGSRYSQTIEKFHDRSILLCNYFPQNENYLTEKGMSLLYKCFYYNDEECKQQCESYNEQMRIAYNNNDSISMHNLSDFFVIQMATRHSFEPISKDIVGYNNSAYYLEQKGFYQSAIYLLTKIIEESPNRTVAYINLGDAYWGLKVTDQAKQAYQKHIELMKANGKENKIPKRILDRIKD